jgi:hypothetical protein
MGRNTMSAAELLRTTVFFISFKRGGGDQGLYFVFCQHPQEAPSIWDISEKHQTPTHHPVFCQFGCFFIYYPEAPW